MNAGERARLVGDRGDDSGEFEETARVDIAVEAAGMKPQRGLVMAHRDAALDEISLGDRANKRARKREQTPRRFDGVSR